METKQLIKAIKTYNPFVEHVTLSTIFSKMKVGDDGFHTICYGEVGTGKSYSSIELIKKLNLGNDVFIDNNVTARGLFDLMVDFPAYDFILDECSKIMKDKGAQDTIKLTMERKSVSWIKRRSYEDIVFKGNYVININQHMLDALTDRAFVNLTMMNKKMALDFVDYYLEKKDPKQEKEFIEHLQKLLKDVTPIELTKQEMNYIREFVKKRIEINDENLGYSRRTIIRMIAYFKRVKKLFGKLDKEIKIFIEPFASVYIENRRTPTIIDTLLGDEKMEKPALITLLASEGGYSERHARRIVDEEIIKGRLKMFGRMVYV